MWVFDSFSTLVSNATKDLNAKNTASAAAYSGVIAMLFRLNKAMLPIGVCSSTTTAGALNESTSSRFFFLDNESRFQINFTLSLHT
jgi:hypothetical protein